MVSGNNAATIIYKDGAGIEDGRTGFFYNSQFMFP